MRRLTLILSLAVLMALVVSAAALAAPKLSATGNLAFRTAIGENADGDYQLQGNWRTRANLQLDAGSGNITARVIYRIRTTDFRTFHTNPTGNWDGTLYDGYVNIRGSFIPGTPEANLRVGRFDVTPNRWVGTFGRRQALHLTNFSLGPVTTGVYHGWEAQDVTLTALTANAKVDIVDIDAAVVYFKDNRDTTPPVPEHQKTNLDWVISGSAKPINGLSISADFAQNGLRKRAGSNPSWEPEGTDPANAWKVAGELTTVPNFTIRASAWSTDDDFRPVYRHLATRENLDMDRMYTSGYSRAGSTWGDSWIAKGSLLEPLRSKQGFRLTPASKPEKSSGQTSQSLKRLGRVLSAVQVAPRATLFILENK